jgi:hypothetical protein
MERGDRGYHRALVDGIEPGALYLYRLDGRLRQARPRVPLPAPGRARPTRESSILVSGGVTAAGPEWPFVISSCTSFTWEPSAPRARSKASPGIWTNSSIWASRPLELMPVAQFPRRAELGLRRGLSLRGAALLRRPGGPEAARRRLPPQGGSPWRSTSSTTTWARRGTSSATSPLLQRRPQRRRGERH